ncbi:MAG TPA: potassium-transporting ATPase subunit KdpC [Janthinobacterium sp.]|jgi:K+-transporting ATPase ATPase C chain|nr:potassium-transporting ATPase subunit KdpC [Janthinobacterium sp.]
MSSTIRPAAVLFASMTLICGVVYPLVVTGIGQLVFSNQAAGSLIERGGKPVGSRLIGQSFTSPGYFWSRPSATSPMPDNGAGSAGSSLGPGNPAQNEAVKARIDALKAADPGNPAPVPVDLVTASASGLDPDISLAAADYQVRRVAAARHLAPQTVRDLIEALRQKQYFGFFGEPAVNVLELNLKLDELNPNALALGAETAHTR